jgi:hypothetical protein
MASRALIIGPSEYSAESGLASPPGIARSRHWYGEVLKGDKRWGGDRIVVLPENELTSIDGVVRAIQSAADDARSGDTLLVIYIGHGAYWSDLPAPQVHFAVGSSRDGEPYTWLSSWYVYRAMRKSQAALKVLIADCCNSNFLEKLSGSHERNGLQDETLPGVLGEIEEGTCVLAAVKNRRDASAEGCKSLKVAMEEQFRECTAFSGHLLNLLWRGTLLIDDDFTLGAIRDILKADMKKCETHDQPKMILNDARERIPLFSNKRKLSEQTSPEQNPDSPEKWVEIMMSEKNYNLDHLLRDPEKAGKVVELLSRHPDEAGRLIALRVNRRADEEYQDETRFARYWAVAAQALAG